MLEKMQNLNGKCLSGELEVELIPQGTFAQRCRAAQSWDSCFLYTSRLWY